MSETKKQINPTTQHEKQYQALSPALIETAPEGSRPVREFPADSAGCSACECDACRNDGYARYIQADPGGEYKPVEHTDARTTPVVSGDLEECLAAFIRRIIAEEAIHAKADSGK